LSHLYLYAVDNTEETCETDDYNELVSEFEAAWMSDYSTTAAS